MGRAEIILDDLDGSGDAAAVEFTVLDRTFHIDLNRDHAVQLTDVVTILKSYVEHAVEVETKTLYSQLSDEDKAAVRKAYKKTARAKISDDLVREWQAVSAVSPESNDPAEPMTEEELLAQRVPAVPEA